MRFSKSRSLQFKVFKIFKTTNLYSSPKSSVAHLSYLFCDFVSDPPEKTSSKLKNGQVRVLPSPISSCTTTPQSNFIFATFGKFIYFSNKLEICQICQKANFHQYLFFLWSQKISKFGWLSIVKLKKQMCRLLPK